MFTSMLLTITFILICISFGFVSLSLTVRIRSLLLLIPLSISLGFASYIFITHIMSFLIGPQLASLLSLFILPMITATIVILKKKDLEKIEKEITKQQIFVLCLIASIISFLTYLSINRFGILDKEFHIPLGLSIYHNNIYPPIDYFRPEHKLLYHYGGDLLAGAINHLFNIEIFKSYEIISIIFSSTTFFSFLALAWIMTRNYAISLIAGFCAYFGGGFLWLDALIRHITKQLPDGASNWSFLQTFLNLGIHGSIINPPSLVAFVSTFCLGYSILTLSLILFWNMLEKNNLKSSLVSIVFLSISLLSLFLIAEWLYFTFWAGVLIFVLIRLVNKQGENLPSTLALFLTSVVLISPVINTIINQEGLQHLGRENLLHFELKTKPFWITSWGRITDNLNIFNQVSIFSWDFLSEFGLSLLLLPVALVYLIKSKNKFTYLLFICAVATMPIPLFIEFKTSPADFNRLFAFGNIVLTLLITCGIVTITKTSFQKNILIFSYIFLLCASPITGLITSAAFTPYIYLNNHYIKQVTSTLKGINSPKNISTYFSNLNQYLNNLKTWIPANYKNEIEFLKSNTKSNDIAISSVPIIPLFAGVYSVVPSNLEIYKNNLPFDICYSTLLTTLDPFLLNELKIKWIILEKKFKSNLKKEVQETLNNSSLFQLIFATPDKSTNQNNEKFEIYYVKDISKSLSGYKRKTAWLLVNKQDQPIDLIKLNSNKISLFPTSKSSLQYLHNLHKLNPGIRNELITARAITIESLQTQLRSSNLNIKLDMQI